MVNFKGRSGRGRTNLGRGRRTSRAKERTNNRREGVSERDVVVASVNYTEKQIRRINGLNDSQKQFLLDNLRKISVNGMQVLLGFNPNMRKLLVELAVKDGLDKLLRLLNKPKLTQARDNRGARR